MSASGVQTRSAVGEVPTEQQLLMPRPRRSRVGWPGPLGYTRYRLVHLRGRDDPGVDRAQCQPVRDRVAIRQTVQAAQLGAEAHRPETTDEDSPNTALLLGGVQR
jgi:hypothetical protein